MYAALKRSGIALRNFFRQLFFTILSGKSHSAKKELAELHFLKWKSAMKARGTSDQMKLTGKKDAQWRKKLKKVFSTINKNTHQFHRI